MTAMVFHKNVTSFACCCVFACIALTGCSSWDRPYNLRQWEKTRLAAQSAYLDHDYVRAEELLRLSVAFAGSLGASDFRLGPTLALLGNAIGRQNKFAESRSVYEKALASLNESLSKAATSADKLLIEQDIATVALSLGDICLKMDDLPASRQYYDQAVNLYQRWQGKNSSPVLAENLGWSLVGLGELFMKQGNSAQAAETFKAAIDSSGAAQYSSGLSTYLNRLYNDARKGGSTKQTFVAAEALNHFREYMFAAKEAAETGNLESAEKNYQAAADLGSKIGVEDAKLYRAYVGLAKNQERLKKRTQAEQNYRKALEYNQKVNPAGDEDTDEMLAHLARLSHVRNDDMSSRDYLNRQLELRKKMARAENRYQVGETLAALGEISLALGQSAEARRYAADSWEIVQASARTKGDMLIALDSLVRTRLGLGDAREATLVNDHLLEIYKQKNIRTWRCIAAEYRRLAIAALKGERSSESGPSAGALRNTENRLLLINQLTDDAAFLTDQGKVKAASVLAEGAVKLVGSEDSGKKAVREAKVKALTMLATIERQTGNNTRADQLSSELEKLK